MQTLECSKNHNGKLFMDHFPDVRLNNPEKFFVGNELEVILDGESMGTVKVVAVKSFEFSQLGDVLAFLNIGKPKQYYAAVLKSFYGDLAPHQLLQHIVFAWKSRNLETQGKAIMNWWTDIYRDEAHIQPQPQAN